MPQIDWAQLGFAGGMAVFLVLIIWKLGERIIDAFQAMYDSHKADIKEMQVTHREERNECYAKHERMFDKFDETLNKLTTKLPGG